jgi:hypothetical protein
VSMKQIRAVGAEPISVHNRHRTAMVATRIRTVGLPQLPTAYLTVPVPRDLPVKAPASSWGGRQVSESLDQSRRGSGLWHYSTCRGGRDIPGGRGAVSGISARSRAGSLGQARRFPRSASWPQSPASRRRGGRRGVVLAQRPGQRLRILNSIALTTADGLSALCQGRSPYRYAQR